MEHLDKILEEIELPKKLIKTTPFLGLSDLTDKIKTVEVLPATIDTEDEFIKLLTKAQVQTYDSISSKGKIVEDLMLPNMYDIAEEFPSIGKWRVSEELMRTFKQHGHITCNRNIYNECNILPPPFAIDKINCLLYSVFEKRYYQKLKDGTLTISVNLPFAYYNKIHVWDNFFCYDIAKHEYWTTGSEEKRLRKLVTDIALNGIQNPLMMKVENATVVSTKECYGRLLSSMLLRIPTIPVILFITGEQVDELETLVPLIGNKQTMNDLCGPEILFL